MKKKMLMPFAASRVMVFPIAKALEKYYEVEVSYVYGPEPPLPFQVTLPTVKNVDINQINMKDYDIIFGSDPTSLPILLEAQQMGKQVGCTVLDIPYHVFKTNREYNASIARRWEIWIEQYKYMDFIVSWRKYTETVFGDAPHLSLFAPSDPPPLLDRHITPKRQFVYSGVVRPDKGVHNILDALSLIEDIPKLVVVGGGADLEDYANYLSVPYEKIQCSQAEKYEIYRDSIGVVSYPSNEWIPPLSPLEAMTIGKIPIVTRGSEAYRLYSDFATYVEPNNNGELSKILQSYIEARPNGELSHKCIEFCKTYRTHSLYAEKTHNFIEGL